MEVVYSSIVNSNMSVKFFVAVGLPRLAAYWPRVLISAFLFEGLFRLSAFLSPIIFPIGWARMNKVDRYKWCVRKASTCHAVYMVTRSLAIILADSSLRNNPVHGSDSNAESTYAVTVGYFLWDMINTYSNIDMNGWGFMFHAIMSFSVYLLSYAPLMQYYGACFMMFEVSTLFLNMHLDLENYALKDHIMYYLNGMALVSSFFFFRIVYGTILSIKVWKDLASTAIPISMFATSIIRAANIILIGLSYYWFSIIIITAKCSATDANLIHAVKEISKEEAKAK
ncbi:hypothetical protein COEREDRAFT_88671 [Coemansia reversa NRRL 1564]|uniref:TLC domain-containing protein n=1 Tax=Coemansia reversa (strain ATCC 12441 / NRRL 1564) TaxID=763665 RepID=A0A2G5B5Z3_COERN|nr:hypothetical protein COEREDRAFT_88671 [Coemansia reversa NRRL 1564]|eukprot:PIA14425.1 hypothetical protein COEREDRAFT_88671 [Coemansia reversa NRRL 1564]